MVTKKDHHWSQCLAFPDYWGKVKEVKIEKLKLQYRKNERVRLITTRFEQILEFFDEIKDQLQFDAYVYFCQGY